MNTHRVISAAGVIHAAMLLGKSLPTAFAYDLEAAGLLQSPETAAELSRLVNDRARWQSRYYEESRTYWDAELPPGGECCADCGQPVESEPCAQHHPATVVARLADENEQLRARVAELEAAQATFLLPWAHQLDAKSLDNFVADLARAADTPLLFVVDEIHQTVAQWRELIASRPAENAPAPARAAVEDQYVSPLHQEHKVPHDLPEVPRG